MKFYRVTNLTHSNFQIPIDITYENEVNCYTEYTRIKQEELSKALHSEEQPYVNYKIMVDTIKSIMQMISTNYGVYLKKDLYFDFVEDNL